MHIFHWSDEIIDYLAQHDVSPEEFETVFEFGRDVRNRDERGEHDARIGYDNRGRLLFCSFDDLNGIDIIPVTAFEIKERKRRRP